MGSTFFGMHEGRVTLGTVPAAPVGALRFWDSLTTWRDLEPSPGQYVWGGLDTAVSAAEKAHARPMLVLGQTPSFYASRPAQPASLGPGAASMPDLAAWRRYVAAVAERYGDRIDYQIWNEADVVNYWTGTPRQMAELTVTAARVIHSRVPDATVVAPPFVLRLAYQRRWFRDFWSLQRHGIDLASAVDVVSLNLYPRPERPPEAEVPIYQRALRTLTNVGVDRPVWNTEINYGVLGGPTTSQKPEEIQRAFVMRTFLLNAGMGVRRVYWYRWDMQPIANTLMTTADLTTPTLAGRSLSTLRHWLLGARVGPCRASAGVWRCSATQRGKDVTFLWKPHGPSRRLTAPAGSRSWVDAGGTSTPCRARCRVDVGPAPVMVLSS